MKIEMIVERTKTGYSAYSEKYPVFTVGKTLQELKTNMLEALNLRFEAKGKIFTEADLKITLDLPTPTSIIVLTCCKAINKLQQKNDCLKIHCITKSTH